MSGQSEAGSAVVIATSSASSFAALFVRRCFVHRCLAGRYLFCNPNGTRARGAPRECVIL
jgi:hypothetical protein